MNMMCVLCMCVMYVCYVCVRQNSNYNKNFIQTIQDKGTASDISRGWLVRRKNKGGMISKGGEWERRHQNEIERGIREEHEITSQGVREG
jgi:hypothetical protein